MKTASAKELDAVDWEGYTALFLVSCTVLNIHTNLSIFSFKASEKGNTDCVELLLKANAGVDIADDDGYSPLMVIKYVQYSCMNFIV